MYKLFLAGGLLLAATAPVQAASNLVTNGDFEQTTMSGNFQFDDNYAPGVGKLTGWSSTAGYNLLFHSDNANTSAGSAVGNYSSGPGGTEYMWASTPSPTGGNFVALDGDQNIRGTLYQQITGLVAGRQYLLTFNWGAGQLHSRTGDTTEQLVFGLGIDINSAQVYSTKVLSNPSQQFTGWNAVSAIFTATSDKEFLAFASVGTPTGLPPIALLDSVSLAAVPENATWMTMILGFGLVGSAIRRARQPTIAAA